MRRLTRPTMIWCGAAAALLGAIGLGMSAKAETPKQPAAAAKKSALAESTEIPSPRPIAPFVTRGIQWIIKAQHEEGGWGAGSHANQKNRDARKVQIDPATSAFVATALLRIGNTPTEGEYKDVVRRATEYLVGVVEKYDKPGPKITDLTGTQIQAKLGPLVDTVMTSQYLARVLPTIPTTDPLHKRVDKALDECLAKLEQSQMKDGSWNVGGGWAPVLQSSQATSALELAIVANKPVARQSLARARKYQKGNFDRKTGKIRAEASAGVALYALSGSQRANAAEARAANDLIEGAKRQGRLPLEAEVSVDNLRKIGVGGARAKTLTEATKDIDAQTGRMNDDAVLRGFGNNGGEEYMSYLQTSESLVILGGQKWDEWNDKMHTRLAKVQSQDGSWTGHHCITSPVVCTAAVVQCLTTDRDAATLIQIAKKAAEDSRGDEKIQTAQNPS